MFEAQGAAMGTYKKRLNANDDGLAYNVSERSLRVSQKLYQGHMYDTLNYIPLK